MNDFLDSLRLVVASANPDKVIEMRAILQDALGGDVELVARPAGLGDVEETGETLEENARLKARAVRVASGLAAVSDDTGLEVAALDGAPGIFTARYAGAAASYEANVAKLLRELDGASDRSATFRTVVLLQNAIGDELVAEGTVQGSIATERRGERGFGYDSVFIPVAGDGRTYAQMTAEEKNALSHRGNALRALAVQLRTKK